LTKPATRKSRGLRRTEDANDRRAMSVVRTRRPGSRKVPGPSSFRGSGPGACRPAGRGDRGGRERPGAGCGVRNPRSLAHGFCGKPRRGSCDFAWFSGRLW